MNEWLQKQPVEGVLQMALEHCGLSDGFVYHSGRGSQYTRRDILVLLRQHQISGTGNYHHSAMMERLFVTFKIKSVIKHFESRQQAHQTIFEYIEIWYNLYRRHSTLGNPRPEQYEQLGA